MPKQFDLQKVTNPRTAEKFVTSHGGYVENGHGSHKVAYNPNRAGKVVYPAHGNQEFHGYVGNKIRKQLALLFLIFVVGLVIVIYAL